jgi:hypothetical protein
MAQRLAPGMICGVEIWPSKKPFQTYLAMLVRRMLIAAHFEFWGSSTQWNVSFAKAVQY